MPQPLFHKVVGQQQLQGKKETPTHLVFCEFCEIFENRFSAKDLQVTASGSNTGNQKSQQDHGMQCIAVEKRYVTYLTFSPHIFMGLFSSSRQLVIIMYQKSLSGNDILFVASEYVNSNKSFLRLCETHNALQLPVFFFFLLFFYQPGPGLRNCKSVFLILFM